MCVYVQVPCVHKGCGELVTRANLAEHLEKWCQFRMEKCNHCQTLVEFAFLEVHMIITLLKLSEIGSSLPLRCPDLRYDPIN